MVVCVAATLFQIVGTALHCMLQLSLVEMVSKWSAGLATIYFGMDVLKRSSLIEGLRFWSDCESFCCVSLTFTK